MWYRPFFRGHVVWITGAGSGIGKGLALEFVRRGAKVALSGRRWERLEETATECQRVGGEALVVPCDVRDDDSVKNCVEEILRHFGRIDVAVANAGFSVKGKVEKLTVEDWKRQFETNVFGVIRTVRAVLEEIKKNQGRIAIIGSVMGSICLPEFGPYQASKFAVRALAHTLYLELYPTGASCTHIQPGLVESELFRVDNQGQYHPDWQDRRPKFFMWTKEKAAQVIVKAIYQRRREYVFTGHGKLATFFAHHFPGFTYALLARFGKYFTI